MVVELYNNFLLNIITRLGVCCVCYECLLNTLCVCVCVCVHVCVCLCMVCMCTGRVAYDFMCVCEGVGEVECKKINIGMN